MILFIFFLDAATFTVHPVYVRAAVDSEQQKQLLSSADAENMRLTELMDNVTKPQITLVETLKIKGAVELLFSIALKLFYDMILFSTGGVIFKETPVVDLIFFTCGALITTLLMTFSRPFMGILVANCLLALFHIITIASSSQDVCTVDCMQWACYVLMVIKGAATIGQYYVYCYVAPIIIAERVYVQKKYYIFGSMLGICLGLGRLIRIVILDNFLPVVEGHAFEAHLLCLVLLAVISLILFREIRNDLLHC